MSSKRLPDGIIAASLTPLTSNLNPNRSALAHHVQSLLNTGCDGVLLFGTTGEALSFTVEERMRGLEAVLDAGIPPHRLLVGTSAAALPDAIRLTTHAAKQEIGGVMVLPPFHFPQLSNAGLLATYDQLITHVGEDDLRLYLYDYPRLTGFQTPLSVIETLSERYPTQIAGIKDSSDQWDHKDALCTSFPDLQVFTGTERHLTPLLRAGGAGCVSAVANLTAPLAQQVVQDWEDNAQFALAQSSLSEFRTRLSQFPAVPALKQLMAWREEEPAWIRTRPPLAPLDKDEKKRLRTVHESLEAQL